MARSSSHPAGRKRTGKRRTLKIFLVGLAVLLLLLVLNAFALDRETGSASLNVDGAKLVSTTSGDIQVLDTGEPVTTDPTAPDPLPVVLIHGSGGAINWWDDLIPLIGPTNRTIAVDMLGYGGSSKPDSGYSMTNQANLIAQVLEQLGTGPAIIVGHSLGGNVATALAEQSPALVAGVTIIDDAPSRDYGGLGGTAKLARMPLIGQALWRISPDFMVRKSIEQAFAPGFPVADKYVEDINEMTYTAYKDSYTEGTDFTAESPLNTRLTAVGKPLLVIFGEEDQIFPARESISAYAAIPGVQTMLIPGVGHSPQVEAPQKTAIAILDFANGVAESLEPPPAPKPEPKKNTKKQQGQNNQPNKQSQNGKQIQQQKQKSGQNKQKAAAAN